MQSLKTLEKVNLKNTTEDSQMLNNLTNKYIVSPLLNLGFAGIVFDRPTEETIEIRNIITSHFVENNSTIQDHIARQPIRISFSGQMAELVYQTPSSGNKLQQLAEKLTIINSFIPTLTSTAKKLMNNINQYKSEQQSFTDTALNSTIDIYQTFKTLNPPNTSQAKFFNFVRALSDAQIKFGADTPWGYIPNMVIESITGNQGAESRYVSDFVVTLMEYRAIDTQYVDYDPKKWKNRASSQEAKPEGLNKIQGATVQKPKELISTAYSTFITKK